MSSLHQKIQSQGLALTASFFVVATLTYWFPKDLSSLLQGIAGLGVAYWYASHEQTRKAGMINFSLMSLAIVATFALANVANTDL